MRWLIIFFLVAFSLTVTPDVTRALVVSASSAVVDAYPDTKIAVIMVTFSDNPAKPIADDKSGPWTKQYLDGVLFTNADSMAAYYARESEGAMTVSGDVYDNNSSWYTVTRPTADGSSCSWNTFFPDVLTAADADIDFSRYNSIMIFTPRYDCDSGGLATTVANVPDTGGKRYHAAVLNGTLNTYPHHELGHMIGFGHANSWQCDPPGVLTGTNCRTEEYGDRYGIMGASSRMVLLPAPLKEYLGWLQPSEITTASADGDYTINMYEQTGTEPKVLKIPQARDAAGNVTSWYYLEYRQPVGYDNVVNTPTIQELGVPNGVLVRLGPVTAKDMTTTLLDMTPGQKPSGLDIFKPALPTGYAYSDKIAGISFGVLSRTSTTMTIRVQFSGKSLCVRHAPSITVKAIKGSGRPGQQLRYTATVKNRDVLCGQRTIELRTVQKPIGWTAAINKSSVGSTVITSGASATFDVRITSAKQAARKTYAVVLEARQKAAPIIKSRVTLKPTVTR